MTLNNSMSITPSPPGHAKGVRFEHGSVLGGKTWAAWVSSQRKSTLPGHLRKPAVRFAPPPGAFPSSARQVGFAVQRPPAVAASRKVLDKPSVPQDHLHTNIRRV